MIFHSFDPVTVRLSLDTTNVQHEKLVLKLVKPFIPDFSVADEADSENEVKEEKNVSPPKRKIKIDEDVGSSKKNKKKNKK